MTAELRLARGNVFLCRIGRAGLGEIQPVSDARLLAARVGISPNIEPQTGQTGPSTAVGTRYCK
jgi:hypothetical protein